MRADIERQRPAQPQPAAQGYLVYSTCRDEEEARRIGRTVVERRLAACANILGGVTSYYWWQGRLQEDSEALLLLKTTAQAVEPLMQAIRELHSYTVPAISAVPLHALNPAYLQWMQEEVRVAGGDGR
ncbi:MAG TPA: divalent-cation tolerance protein CutA [Limnochordales bacterium]